jgi:signal transduction histidine kinase
MKKLILISLNLIPFFAFSQIDDGIQLDTHYIRFGSTETIKADFIEPEKIFVSPPPIDTSRKLSADDVAAIEADKEILKKVPKSYDNVSPADMKKIAQNLENELQRLIAEKEALLKSGASPEVIESKSGTINSLNKEKNIVNLTIDKDKLTTETGELKSEKKTLKKYLAGALVALSLMFLAMLVLIQRKTIKVQDKEILDQLKAINKKNNYLEHAARIIRHDMHSGINTYMPRGLSSLEKRITEEEAKNLKIDGSIKMIKEGLAHTQKVYKSVYEFTNLVKPNSVLEKVDVDISKYLEDYISNTSYKSQVKIEKMNNIIANPFLFCTAVDNLIRNGLKFNDSEDKIVRVFREDKYIIIEDNGRGLDEKTFEDIKENKNKQGLGLNICIAILEEHGFLISCKKIGEKGTQMKIHT